MVKPVFSLNACLRLALLLSLAIFGLRGHSLLSRTADTPGADKAGLVSLLETVTGQGQVRVQPDPLNKAPSLIVLDGPEGPADPDMSEKIKALITAIHGPDFAEDQLSFIQYPFAGRASQTLSSGEALELLGLFFLIGCQLLCLWRLPQAPLAHETAQTVRETLSPPTVLIPSDPDKTETQHSHQHAAQAARAHPDYTVALIRRWMGRQETLN